MGGLELAGGIGREVESAGVGWCREARATPLDARHSSTIVRLPRLGLMSAPIRYCD